MPCANVHMYCREQSCDSVSMQYIGETRANTMMLRANEISYFKSNHLILKLKVVFSLKMTIFIALYCLVYFFIVVGITGTGITTRVTHSGGTEMVRDMVFWFRRFSAACDRRNTETAPSVKFSSSTTALLPGSNVGVQFVIRFILSHDHLWPVFLDVDIPHVRLAVFQSVLLCDLCPGRDLPLATSWFHAAHQDDTDKESDKNDAEQA